MENLQISPCDVFKIINTHQKLVVLQVKYIYIGNYYSLMRDHVKAIQYFKKALKLDKSYLAAWTLMGHEYLEMKNISGAI